MAQELPHWALYISGPSKSDIPWHVRVATPDDHAFCELLYVETMKPLLCALNAWAPYVMLPKLRAYFLSSDTLIIVVDDRDVGWLQVEVRDHDYVLTQMHLLPQFRRRGIGSGILAGFLRLARETGRPVALSVVKNNPARALYEAHGFVEVARAGWRVDMAFKPD